MGAAGWDDPNIVLQDGQWEHIPPDTWGTPNKPYDNRWQSANSTIIILVAALRESRLPATIISAFDNAKYPERIRFGIVQQNEALDPDCIESVCEQRGRPLVRTGGGPLGGKTKYANPNGCFEFDRVRVVRMKASEAAGPVYARGLQATTVEDEDFCLQIDAHTIFIEQWDLALLKEWGMTENEFGVLTTYPTNYKDLHRNSNNHWEMPHICGVRMSSTGELSNHQAGAAANLNRPLIAPVWAAGLSFSRCHAERHVPNDKNLKQIFSGEEFSRGARLWTHGYDFYSITRPAIGVYYGGEKGGKGSWHHDHQESVRSRERLKTLLKMPNSDQSEAARARLGSYALGTKRTLEQYAEFCGVDTILLRAAKAKCVVKYVPWDDAGVREQLAAEDQALKNRFHPAPTTTSVTTVTKTTVTTTTTTTTVPPLWARLIPLGPRGRRGAGAGAGAGADTQPTPGWEQAVLVGCVAVVAGVVLKWLKLLPRSRRFRFRCC